MTLQEINKEIGNMDIYLLDILLKGYIKPQDKILDAGCGEGRNLHYFLKNNYNVFGIDLNDEALAFVRLYAKQFMVDNLNARFQRMDSQKLLFPDRTFDLVISSAVLHFLSDEEQVLNSFSEFHRVLNPGGTLFVRCMTNDFHLGTNRDNIDYSIAQQYAENSQRFMFTHSLLDKILNKGHFELLEPYKYVMVEGKHSMNVLVLTAK